MNKIPEERVPTILKRAAELDRETMTIDNIRGAAIEAGISETAVDQAIAEFRAGDVMPVEPTPVVAKAPFWTRALRGAADVMKIAALAGFFGAMMGEAEAMIPLNALAWTFIAFRLAHRARPKRTARRFQIINAAIGFGVFSGALMFNAEDAAMSFLVIGIGLIAAGTIYIQFRWSEWLQGTPENNKA